MSFLYNIPEDPFMPGGMYLTSHDFEINPIDANGQEVKPEDFGGNPNDPLEPFTFEFETDGVAYALECWEYDENDGDSWMILFKGYGYQGNEDAKELTFGEKSAPEPEPSGDNIFVGDTPISNVYVGQIPVSKMFVGETQVYPSESGSLYDPDAHVVVVGITSPRSLLLPVGKTPSYLAVNGVEVAPASSVDVEDGDIVEFIADWEATSATPCYFSDIIQFGLNSRTGQRNQVAVGKYAFYNLNHLKKDFLSSPAISNLDVSNLTDCSYMFKNAWWGGDVSKWDTSGWTSIAAFAKPSSTSTSYGKPRFPGMDKWDTHNISNWGSAFYTHSGWTYDLSMLCASAATTYSNFGPASITPPVWGTCPRGEDQNGGGLWNWDGVVFINEGQRFFLRQDGDADASLEKWFMDEESGLPITNWSGAGPTPDGSATNTTAIPRFATINQYYLTDEQKTSALDAIRGTLPISTTTNNTRTAGETATLISNEEKWPNEKDSTEIYAPNTIGGWDGWTYRIGMNIVSSTSINWFDTTSGLYLTYPRFWIHSKQPLAGFPSNAREAVDAMLEMVEASKTRGTDEDALTLEDVKQTGAWKELYGDG